MFPEWGKDMGKIVSDPMLYLDNIYESAVYSTTTDGNLPSKVGTNHMHATMIKRCDLCNHDKKVRYVHATMIER